MRNVVRRKAAADQKAMASRPSSTRAAGAGGSNQAMMKLYSDEATGLKVDPVVVIVISLSFIGSVFALQYVSLFCLGQDC